MKRLSVLCELTFFVCSVCLAAGQPLKNPDLTKGEKPSEVKSYGMGPTGFVGWIFNNERDSSESRQILVTVVEAKSPADGVLEKDDVILGADGSGAEGAPAKFELDARKALAAAIEAAEARNPAKLKLLRWCKGETTTVTLTLETMGKYADTAPYNCDKSKKILAKGLECLYANGKPKLFNMNALILMAANDPKNPNNEKYQAKAREWVYELIPSEDMMKAMLDDFSKVPSSKPAWTHAYQLIVLTEYYLQTKDAKVLPAIEAYAVCYAKGQSWLGTTGHDYSQKRPDGGFNGPMAGYGAISGSGVAGFLGLVLARKCGLENPEVIAAIDRADLFFSQFAFRGGIGYGEYGPELGEIMYDMNGKHATTALALALQPKRAKESQYFMKLTACSSYERAFSHAGPYFNYVWPGLGAGAGGEKLAAHYFRRTRWDHELSRMWNGRFTHAPLNRAGADADNKREAEEVAALLIYTLPLRQLYITGRDQDRKLWLSKKEFEETVAAEDFDPKGLSDDELLAEFDNWSPNVRAQAVEELAGRNSFKTLLPRLYQMATDTKRSRISRAHACVIVGKVGDETSADLLVGLLKDEESWVRFAAARSLRGMSKEIKMKHVNEFLSAVAATSKPMFPLDPDDPLQQAQGELAMILFYDGNAYGPRGILSAGIDGVDRKLLFPAIRAVAQNGSGLRRSTLRSVYPKLTYEEVLELAPTIVESVRVVAPADAMFSSGVQLAGAKLLMDNRIADGVPLLKVCDYRIKRETPDILAGYAGGLLTVQPDPDALDFIYEKLYVYGDTNVQKVIDAVWADTNPKPLKSLKTIHSVTAEAPVLTLPTGSTTLRVKATNYARPAEKDSFYTWRKVYGAGDVAFKPNKTWDSKTTSVQFVDKRPGKYRFEVIMSDVLGYTIVREPVDVTLNGEDGKLPVNQPPQAQSKAFRAIPGMPGVVRLTAADPEKDALAFTISNFPSHGKLAGVPPNVIYTADLGYVGKDAFTFEVIDGQSVAATGTISLFVKPEPVGVTIYEGFNYPSGDLNGQSGNTAVGLEGKWSAGGNRTAYTVADGSFCHANMPSTGGKLSSMGGSNTATRPIDLSAIARDGLLKDGGGLWFSAVMGRHEKINFRNSSLSFGLRDGANPKGADVGLFWSTMSIHAAINGEQGRSAVEGPGWQVVFSANTPLLFVGHCVWGTGADKPDKVTLYRVFEDHKGQLVRLKNPVSTCSAVVDQSKLNMLYIFYSGGLILDEVRVGPTYESVVLGTVPTMSPNKGM